MADEDKTATIHELKAKFDANNSFLKQVSGSTWLSGLRRLAMAGVPLHPASM